MLLLYTTSAGWNSLSAAALEQANALSCDEMATYTIVNYQGNLISAQPVSTSGFQFGNFSFDPGLGTFTFSSVSYTNYRGFGSFEVELNLGGEIVIVSGKVAECCQAIAYDRLFIDQQVDPITYSGETILLFGDVTVTDFTEFNLSTVLLGVDAQIILQGIQGATMHSNSSTFDKFCDYAWDQIVLNQSDESLMFSGSTLKESIRGVHSLSNVPVNLESSNFENNVVSLYVENHSGAGSFQGSHLRLDGCTFDFTRSMNPFNIHPSSPIDPNNFFPTSCSGIDLNNQLKAVPVYVGNSDHVNIGHDTYQQNTFEMSSPNSIKAIAVENAQVFIKNNSTNAQYLESVCSSNQSKVNIGGDVAAEGNTLGSGFVLENSSLFVANNTVQDGASSNSGSTVRNIEYVAPATGRRQGGEISHNSFNASTGTTQELLVEQNNNGSYLRIFDNDFNQYTVTVTNFPKLVSFDRLVIHSNEMHIESVGAAVGYSLEKIAGATFANNLVDGPTNETTVTNDDGITGVYWEGGTNAEFYGNTIRNWNYGLRIKDNNWGTQFECNTFTNDYFGIYLDNASINDQGSSSMAGGNQFLEFFTLPTIPYSWRLTGTASQPVNSTWYQYPDPLGPACNVSPPATPHAQCIKENLISVIPNQATNENVCTSLPANFKRDPNSTNNGDGKTLDDFSVYPNPASDIVQVILTRERSSSKLTVHNQMGQLYYVEENPTKGEVAISTATWPAGVYLVRYGHQTQKLIVQ